MRTARRLSTRSASDGRGSYALLSRPRCEDAFRRPHADARRSQAVHRHLPPRRRRPLPGGPGAYAVRQQHGSPPGIGAVLRPKGLCLHRTGLPWPLRLRRGVRRPAPGGGGRSRHTGVDRRPGVVQRQGRHGRRVVRRPDAVAGRPAQEQLPQGHRAPRRPVQLLDARRLHWPRSLQPRARPLLVPPPQRPHEAERRRLRLGRGLPHAPPDRSRPQMGQRTSSTTRSGSDTPPTTTTGAGSATRSATPRWTSRPST